VFHALKKEHKLRDYSYEHHLLRGSTGPKAGEVKRYWKNYIRSLKIVYFTQTELE
jgi:hypothetical protein